MKKVVLVLIALLLATTMVFAQSNTETVQEAKPEVVDIKIWYSISGANGDFFKSQVEAFLANHPEIKAEMTYSGSYADSATKISAARLANEAPDMIITSASQLYPGEDGNFRMEELVKGQRNQLRRLPGRNSGVCEVQRKTCFTSVRNLNTDRLLQQGPCRKGRSGSPEESA